IERVQHVVGQPQDAGPVGPLGIKSDGQDGRDHHDDGRNRETNAQEGAPPPAAFVELIDADINHLISTSNGHLALRKALATELRSAETCPSQSSAAPAPDSYYELPLFPFLAGSVQIDSGQFCGD